MATTRGNVVRAATTAYQESPEVSMPFPNQATAMAAPEQDAISARSGNAPRAQISRPRSHASSSLSSTTLIDTDASTAPSADALSSYHLGEPLGKGASATVHKAFNWRTGETVAIKRVELAQSSRSVEDGSGVAAAAGNDEVEEMMSEIDLLRNLNHPNIVKYRGFHRTPEYLYIILEYCENGSLAAICKRHGKFPEDLVAIYMRQVLDGLAYLHSQGVIHRDVKGANILTNKDGTVKLADFGVSTMMPGVNALGGEARGGAGSRTSKDESVVGSPYWMAPEIIEQNGATTASDIWSLGCLVIELLDARPPYHALEPMQALFRIVQDDSPPIPEGASPVVRDFLSQCFQKDPNLRVSAKKLARHPWMLSVQPAAAPAAPVTSPLMPKRNRVIRPRTTSTQGLAPRPLTTAYAQAVKRVQEWNEALNAAPSKSRPLRRVAPLHSSQPVVEESSSGDSLAAHLARAQPRSRLARAESSDDGNWDDDFADDVPRRSRGEEDNTKTVMPLRSPRDEDDWSDLGPFNEGELKRKLRALKSGNAKIYSSDLARIDATWKSTSKKARPRLISPVNLAKYAEDDEDDLTDLVIEKPICRDTLQLNSRHSDRSWNDSEEQDPFEALDDAITVEDVEANLERDKVAKLCADVVEQIDVLQPKSSDEGLFSAIAHLISLLDASPDLADHFVSSNGPMCVVEMLEVRRSRKVTLELLRLVNRVASPEAFCLVGGIPPIMALTALEYPLATRVEAAAFVESLTSSPSTLSMFIACRGLHTLVGLLDEDWNGNRALVLSALKGISSVFALPAATSRDYCRLFVREGIAEAMSSALDGVVAGGDYAARQQLVSLVLLFCQNVQSDPRIRDAVGTRHFVSRLIDACPDLEPPLLITMLKALKHLSAAPSLRDVLDSANAIRFLVRTLQRHSDGANDLCSHILQTLYNLCRLSRSRQGEAARSGLLPVLRQLIDGNSQLKEFALPIVCEMVHAGKEARRQLWRIDGLAVYLSLLEDPYWRISSLDAIVTWLQDETARVEDRLLEKPAVALLLLVFTKASGVSFDGILEPWSKILRTSRAISLELAQGPMFKRVADALSLRAISKPTTRLALLRILKTVGEGHPDLSLATKYGISDVLHDLADRDEAVLVRQLAKEVSALYSQAPRRSTSLSTSRLRQ